MCHGIYILIWCTVCFRVSVTRNAHLDSRINWVYCHADCCWKSSVKGSLLEQNLLYSQNLHVKFQLSLLPLQSPHIFFHYFLSSQRVFLLVWYNLNLAVLIQIVRNNIYAPHFKWKYNMIVGLDLLLLSH